MLELISFFTRLPSNRLSLEKAAKQSFLLPVLGGLVGLIVGAFSLFAFKFIDRFLAALLTAVCLYFITGLNHLDGLSDFADGLYTCGGSEKKIKVMKDTQTGVAGITFVLFVILFFIFAVFMLNGNIYKILVAEVCAKTAMLFALFFGKSMKTGIGKLFIEGLNKSAVPFSILFSLCLSFILLRYLGLLAVLTSMFSSLIIVKIAHRNFGAINGDVIGAVNELSRVVSLLTLSIRI